MKIAIFGGEGMLGTELCKIWHTAVSIPHKVISVENVTAPVLDGFDVVINCAAYHDVDKCEHNPNRAFETNYLGPRNLAYACRKLDIRLLHMSTNMVFNGQQATPYATVDRCDPKTVYGYSKWLGECAILEEIAHGLSATIIRLPPIYGHAPNRGKGRNFVSTVRRLAAENKAMTFPLDQMVNPLFTLDVVECLYWSILAENSFGRLPIVHLGSSNSASFYEIAREILNLEGLKNPISGVFSPRGCKYPLNGVLKPSLVVPTWQESLQRYFINEPEAA